MSSLRQIIKDSRDYICNGIAWVAIYKNGRSWASEAFYPEDGDFENGYAFHEDDYERMKEIVDLDHKAICINGDYMGGLEDFTLDELENKILWFYESRYHQLKQDFLECFVVPPEAVQEKQKSVEDLLVGATERVAAEKGVSNGKDNFEFEKV